MLMIITCPHCGFSREVSEDRIPAGSVSATCPRCRKPFPLGPGTSETASAARQRPEVKPAREETPPFSESQSGAGAAAETALEDRYISPAILPKAGFWIRVVAAVVDSVLVTVIQFAFQLVLGLIADGAGGNLSSEGEVMLALITGLFGTVLAIAYYVFFVGYCGQTPGKMAIRAKIIRTDGSEIGYWRAFLREVIGKFVSSVLLGIGYLMVAFDSQKQGLHDKIADTYVIKL